ncbi:MAG: hypothetical protein ACKPFF_36310, partial [Planktothrix sp.]
MGGSDGSANSRWLIQAKTGTTKYNLVFGAGDGPNRPGEHNGGLQNFPRFVENWRNTGTGGTRGTVQIQGSFIQLRRSRYATAPAIPLQTQSSSSDADKVKAPSFFGLTGVNNSDVYNLSNVDGRLGYYTAPNRN